jgi:Flp pilus assembly pilin Flp
VLLPAAKDIVMLKNLYRDANGVIISLEMVLIVTIAVLAIVVGWSEVAIALNTEWNDVSNATGALSQDYSFTGYQVKGNSPAAKSTSSVFGSLFHDQVDDCDTNGSCDIVCGIGSVQSEH